MHCGLLVSICAVLASCYAFLAPCGKLATNVLTQRRPCVSSNRQTSQLGAVTDTYRTYTPPKYLINAVKNNRDQKITVADVSLASGVELSSAQKDLMLLAQVTGARLQVTKSGDIVYAFPQGIDQAILRYSVARRFQLYYEKVAPTLSFLFRASFGIILVTSIGIVTTALVAATTAASEKNKRSEDDEDDEEDKKKRRAQHTHHHHHHYHHYNRVHAVLDLADIFHSVARLLQLNQRYQAIENNEQQMNALDGFFSFVFGDGDPNKDFQLQAAAMAAQLILANRGVVVAEQLAPLLPHPPAYSPAEADRSDESFMLPLLLRFNGAPSVTQAGNIAYTFQELIASADDEEMFNIRSNTKMGKKSAQPSSPPLLLEEEISFSRASAWQKFLATGLAGVNLAGAMALGRVVSGSAPWVKAIYPVLLSYAVLFTAVPAGRMLLNGILNSRIRERNARRLEWLQHVVNSKSVHAKWQDACNSTEVSRRLMTDAEIVYDSNLPYES